MGNHGTQHIQLLTSGAFRQSAILIGPTCSGKRRLASHLGSRLRRILTLDECVEWTLSASEKKKKLNGAGRENGRLLEELIRHLDTQEAEADAMNGKKSKLHDSDGVRHR